MLFILFHVFSCRQVVYFIFKKSSWSVFTLLGSSQFSHKVTHHQIQIVLLELDIGIYCWMKAFFCGKQVLPECIRLCSQHHTQQPRPLSLFLHIFLLLVYDMGICLVLVLRLQNHLFQSFIRNLNSDWWFCQQTCLPVDNLWIVICIEV